MGCNDFYNETKWEQAARKFMEEKGDKKGEEFIFALAHEFEKRDKKQIDSFIERTRRWFMRDFYN